MFSLFQLFPVFPNPNASMRTWVQDLDEGAQTKFEQLDIARLKSVPLLQRAIKAKIKRLGVHHHIVESLGNRGIIPPRIRRPKREADSRTVRVSAQKLGNRNALRRVGQVHGDLARDCWHGRRCSKRSQQNAGATHTR